MNLLTIDKKNPNFSFVEKIKKGAVFMVLTDTIYGLSCIFDNSKSLNKIKEIKKIKSQRPFIVLVSDFFMLKKYFDISPEKELFLRKAWDKKEEPVSVVLNAKDCFYKKIKLNKKNGVAVRLPRREFLIKMIKLINKPLISTSCNITGEKFLNNINDIECFFRKNDKQPDIILKFKGERPKKKPSRLIDLRDFENIKIIRP